MGRMETSMGRYRAGLSLLGALATVALAGPTAPVLAQDAAPNFRVLQGVVLDELTLQPVPGVMVSLLGTDLETVTDEQGLFTFESPPEGLVSVRVMTPERLSLVQNFELDSGSGVAYVQFALPPIDVMVSQLIAQEKQLPETNLTAADLVTREVPGLGAATGSLGFDARPVQLRGVSSMSLSSEPLLFLNGVRIRGVSLIDALSQIPAEDVEDIEILRGPAAAFLYAYAANGVIHVKTRQGDNAPD
jgi:hypothetical protein